MGKSFVDGLLALIISILYMLIPSILAILLGVGSLIVSSVVSGPAGSMGGLAMGGAIAANIGFIILCIVAYILFSLLLIPALVNFARKGFGAAFSFGTLFDMISKAGWLKYILSIILIWIIFSVIIFICMLLSIIIIGIILLIFIMPFLYCWGAKYFANLFE